jgi:site-specific DNA recombinase
LRGPRGRRWREGAVKRVLANEKYRGLLIWGKKTFDRRPGTGQYVARPVARDQWRTLERPDLRIVPEDVWARVAARRQSVRDVLPEATGRTLMRGKNAALHSPHLFSGFMRCATCGGAVVTVTGGYGSPRYGCLQSWRNGVEACANRLTIRAKVADAYLLASLKAELLAPTTLQYVTDVLSDALNRRIDERPRLLAETRTSRERAAQRLQRLVDAIENGVAASTLADAIHERQGELAALDATLCDLDAPLADRLAVMPTWVRQQLEDLVALLCETPERTKTEFQRLQLQVTMTPQVNENGRRYYQADVVNSLACLSGSTEMRTLSPSTVDRSDLRAGQ